MLFIGNIISEAVKTYRCPSCGMSFKDDKLLYLHVMRQHENEIPDDVTAKQYVFNKRRNKEYQICTICQTEKTKWNEKTGRYSLVCESPECKRVARERFLKNYKKKHGKDHSINDPEIQKQMMYNKKNSGEYEFQDGGKIKYASGYELDFLKLLDLDLGFPSDVGTIRECDIYFPYKYEGKDHFYVPDYYMEIYDLIIEIKASDNKHPKILAVDKETELLKDKAVKKDGSHNYIKIVDKKYEQFLELIKVLKNQHVNSKASNYEKFIIIPAFKPPTGDFRMPELVFLKDKEIFKESRIMFVYDKMKTYSKTPQITFQLVLDKEFISNEYIEEEDFKDNPNNRITLRETQVDVHNDSKVAQAFREFSNYYTEKYEKYLNQDFLSTYFLLSEHWFIITINHVNDKDKAQVLSRLIDQIEHYRYITIKTRTGYITIIDHAIRQSKNILRSVLDLLNKESKKAFGKEYYSYTESNQIPIPGTLHGGTLVTILDEYSKEL